MSTVLSGYNRALRECWSIGEHIICLVAAAGRCKLKAQPRAPLRRRRERDQSGGRTVPGVLRGLHLVYVLYLHPFAPGFMEVPGGEQYRAKRVLSVYYYCTLTYRGEMPYAYKWAWICGEEFWNIPCADSIFDYFALRRDLSAPISDMWRSHSPAFHDYHLGTERKTRWRCVSHWVWTLHAGHLQQLRSVRSLLTCLVRAFTSLHCSISKQYYIPRRC